MSNIRKLRSNKRTKREYRGRLIGGERKHATSEDQQATEMEANKTEGTKAEVTLDHTNLGTVWD